MRHLDVQRRQEDERDSARMRTAIAVAVLAVVVILAVVILVIPSVGRDAASTGDMIDVMTATVDTVNDPVYSSEMTCIYKGAPGSAKKVICATGVEYRYSDQCNSEVYGSADFLQLTEGNPPASVIAARARPDRWNIRDNGRSGRPLIGFIIRKAGSYWTLHGPKGRSIGHIVGADAVEAALVYLYFGNSTVECVTDA
jgi:hypothetical protein